MKNNFSIQDWKSNHFSDLIKEDALQSIQQMFPHMDQGEMDSYFFKNLIDTLADYFQKSADELTNMDAMSIANHLRQASKAIESRSGN